MAKNYYESTQTAHIVKEEPYHKYLRKEANIYYLQWTVEIKYQENRSANQKRSNKINRPSSKEEMLVIYNSLLSLQHS